MSGDFELISPTNNKNKDYPIGDVFDSDVMLGSGTNYRAWHVHVLGLNMGRREFGVKIVFRHNPASGVWVLIINGDIKAKRFEKKFDKEFMLTFKLYGRIFEMKVSRNSLKYTYSLNMDGTTVKEIREKADIYMDEKEPQVTITEVRTGHVKGKLITLYQISSTFSTGEKVSVERRYSEFVTLHSVVKGYTGQHLLTTLPHLPGKVLNPFFNQSSPEFLSQRKDSLQNYLITLLNNSKVRLHFILMSKT